MKELSIEEKAKAYDELLAKAKQIYNKENDVLIMHTIEDLFPQVIESEDERIRKAIIEYLRQRLDRSPSIPAAIGSWIAWLEKQGDKDNLIKELGEYKVKYIQEVLENHINNMSNKDDERLKKTTIAFLKDFADQGYENAVECIDWLEKQCMHKPDYCHHEVDLSNCSEEYRKAYYDGWNNCNMQYSQCKSERNDVVKCLINGMKFYYEDNEDATWGTEKFSMKVKDIIKWLEKQGEQKTQYHITIEDIEKAAARYDGSMYYIECFVNGAKWMEQQLKDN